MDILIMLLPVLLPVAGGALILGIPFKSERARDIYAEIVVCATSLAAFYVIAHHPEGRVVLYSIA